MNDILTIRHPDKRRQLLHAGAIGAAVALATGVVRPARAVVPPPLLIGGRLAQVMITVAIERLAVSLLRQILPGMFRSELSKYLLAVALALGMDEVRAALFADRAEAQGAKDLARDGFLREVSIAITNNDETPLKLPRVKVLLVDEATSRIELTSTSYGIVVSPRATMKRKIVCSRYPSPGLKRWHVTSESETLQSSDAFLVIA